MTDIVTRLRSWVHAVDAVSASDLMDEAAEDIERLREAIRRIADQDATLSVCDGSVTVTMDATITDEEREAIKRAASRLDYSDGANADSCCAAILKLMLERLG